MTSEHLERLKEAVQSDFQRIIVIARLEERDSFHTRIEITKTGSGSTFELV